MAGSLVFPFLVARSWLYHAPLSCYLGSEFVLASQEVASPSLTSSCSMGGKGARVLRKRFECPYVFASLFNRFGQAVLGWPVSLPCK